MANQMNQTVHFSTQYCEYRASTSHRDHDFISFFFSLHLPRLYRAALDCGENDYLALLGLCLVYSLANNKGN